MIWTDVVGWTSNLCSTVCWIALTFVFLYVAVTGICLFAMFCEEARKKHLPKPSILRPVPKTDLSGSH